MRFLNEFHWGGKAVSAWKEKVKLPVYCSLLSHFRVEMKCFPQ